MTHSEDLRWDDLRVFLAVLREGSFSAAARMLLVEQSTVSRRVGALERALAGVLFDRTSAAPIPTELAQTLAPIAERAEAEVLAVIETSLGQRAEVSGRVRVALTESLATQLVIPGVMQSLMQRYPSLEIDLVVDDRPADLARREADLALRHYRPAEGDLVMRRLAVLPRAVVGSRSYLAGRKGCALRELDWITQTLPGSVSEDEKYVTETVGARPRLRTTGHLAQVSAVAAGLGVSVLSRAQIALNADLQEVSSAADPPTPVDVWLVTPRALRRIPAVAAVWRHLEHTLSELLAPYVG